MAMKTKRRRNTYYSHMRSDSHGRKGKMQMTLFFLVRVDMAAITKKKEIMDAALDMWQSRS